MESNKNVRLKAHVLINKQIIYVVKILFLLV